MPGIDLSQVVVELIKPGRVPLLPEIADGRLQLLRLRVLLIGQKHGALVSDVVIELPVFRTEGGRIHQPECMQGLLGCLLQRIFQLQQSGLVVYGIS